MHAIQNGNSKNLRASGTESFEISKIISQLFCGSWPIYYPALHFRPAGMAELAVVMHEGIVANRTEGCPSYTPRRGELRAKIENTG